MRASPLKSDIMLLSNCISDLNHCSKIFILSRFDSYYPQIYQTQCCKVLSSEIQGQGICLKNFFFPRVPIDCRTEHRFLPGYRRCTLHTQPSVSAVFPITPHVGLYASTIPNLKEFSSHEFMHLLILLLSQNYLWFSAVSSSLSFKAQLRHRCILESFLTLLDLLAAKRFAHPYCLSLWWHSCLFKHLSPFEKVISKSTEAIDCCPSFLLSGFGTW